MSQVFVYGSVERFAVFKLISAATVFSAIIIAVIVAQRSRPAPQTKSDLMSPKFESASPYQQDVLALPVSDLEQASDWYCKHFGMKEVHRENGETPSVVLERDGIRIGFSINGGDPSQDGAAIRVSNIEQLKSEFESNGIEVGDFREDERDGKKYKVFFVVAPDGLCYYFHQPIDD